MIRLIVKIYFLYLCFFKRFCKFIISTLNVTASFRYILYNFVFRYFKTYVIYLAATCTRTIHFYSLAQSKLPNERKCQFLQRHTTGVEDGYPDHPSLAYKTSLIDAPLCEKFQEFPLFLHRHRLVEYDIKVSPRL